MSTSIKLLMNDVPLEVTIKEYGTEYRVAASVKRAEKVRVTRPLIEKNVRLTKTYNSSGGR